MRIYDNCYELMSETGRNLWEMGNLVKPKHYQNKDINGNEDFETKELICEQYCLMNMPDPKWLFTFMEEGVRQWAEAEFQERISGKELNPGEAWKLRKDIWEEFLVDDYEGEYDEDVERFDYSYPERINQTVRYNERWLTKLESVIQLLRDDPDTRKAILNIYGGYFGIDYTIDDASRLDGSARIPCSMYYDFLIRENAKGEKQLNITYHQRSSDFVTFFGTDVWFAWKLMEYVAKKVGVKPGYLYHTIDSLHCYKKDWVNLKTSLSEM